MSLNWVMLNPSGYPPFHALPNETILHTTNNTISLTIESGKTLPAGDERKKTFASPAGTVYLTNLRVILHTVSADLDCISSAKIKFDGRSTEFRCSYQTSF